MRILANLDLLMFFGCRDRRPRLSVTKIKYLLCENISFCLYEAVTIFSYPSLRTVEDACPYNNV